MVRKQRGQAVCPNTLEVPLDATETAVLKAIEHDILRVEVLETVLAKAMAALQPSPDVLAGPELTLRDELARIDSEVAHLAGAIAAGGELAALLVALQERERQVYLRGNSPRSPVSALPHTGARTRSTGSTNCAGTSPTGKPFCGKRQGRRGVHYKASWWAVSSSRRASAMERKDSTASRARARSPRSLPGRPHRKAYGGPNGK
jgi:hypothetical protein